jgi:hypothetical protein
MPWLLHGFTAVYGRPSVANRVPRVVNLVVSNLPGPKRPMYLAGARVIHHWPLSIVGHGLGLNVTVESYAGALEFGVMTALAAVPHPRTFANGLLAAFDQLQARTRAR